MERLARQLEYTLLPDSAAVAHAAAERILSAAERAITMRGEFKLVLAGGSTPQAAYRILAAADAQWQHWHIYFGDERCLPADDPERNSRMAFEALLDHVAIPREQIHTINAEQGAQTAALEYSPAIEAAMPFDMVLLGMGEDGHTASLFPGQQHESHAWVVPVHDAPKPPPDRISLNGPVITRAGHVVFVVSGESKKPIVSAWKRGAPIPARWIETHSNALLFIEASAID